MSLKQIAFLAVMLFSLSSVLYGQEPSGNQATATSATRTATVQKPTIDRLSTLWTFGNHEPVTMYRRIGGPSTGGITGSALWLEEWHHWFDSEESTILMEKLGLNALHCRFYKGMGWDFESKDYPAVQGFVRNCHKHGIKVLAYVQFATLYYEIMLNEVPDLADWAAVDETGKKYIYGNSAFRWMPCINAPGFEPYLKKIINIALTQGDFDGIMFDNIMSYPCYCPRCQELFRAYLAKEKNPMATLGIPSTKHVTLPPQEVRSVRCEIQDPVRQRWLQFRCDCLTGILTRLYNYAHEVKPEALITGNVWDIRNRTRSLSSSISPTEMNRCYDFQLVQSNNTPGVQGNTIVSRIHEMKLCQEFGQPVLALCDRDGAAWSETSYYLTLIEDAVFGGIPTDRTIVKPDREEGFVSSKLIAKCQPLLERFRAMVKQCRESLDSPVASPVRLLYSNESHMFSAASWKALFATEEILLRNHVPYGLLISNQSKPLVIPDDCRILIVSDQRCLSDEEMNALVKYAQKGGRLIITGQTGQFDSNYRQRRQTPALKQLESIPNVIYRPDVATITSDKHWTFAVISPEKKFLPENIAKLGGLPYTITAPQTVYVELRKKDSTDWIHFVNYNTDPVPQGVRVKIADKSLIGQSVEFLAPLGKNASPVRITIDKNGCVTLPGFAEYAQIRIVYP